MSLDCYLIEDEARDKYKAEQAAKAAAEAENKQEVSDDTSKIESVRAGSN